MHPHTNCPFCPVTPEQKLISHPDLTMFLVTHAGSRNWQALADKLLKKYNITLRKDN